MAESSAMSLETKARPWWLILVDGILALVIGFLIVTAPAANAAVFLVIFLGVYWVMRGIFDIISMFVDHTAWGWKLFTGLLGILAGIVVLRNPVLGGLTVTTLFVWIGGFYSLIGGIIMIIQAFRGGGWGVGIFGVLLIIIGVYLLGLGVTGSLVLTLFLVQVFGFMLIIGGIAGIVQAFRQRS